MSAKRDFWFQNINAWQESELSQAEYIRQHNLSPKSFGYYRRRYFQSQPAEIVDPKHTPLLPVQLEDESDIQNCIILTTPNSYRIELPHGFDTATLTEDNEADDQDNTPDETRPVAAHQRKKPVRTELPKDLPRDIRVLDVPEEEKWCACCEIF